MSSLIQERGQAATRSTATWGKTVGTAVGAAAAVVVLALVGIAAYASLQGKADKIFDGVGVASVDLSGLSQSDAKTQLEAELKPLLEEPVRLTHDDGVVALSMADLGLSLDFDAMVEDAYAQGRGAGLTDNLRARRALKRDGVDLKPRVATNKTAVRDRLSEFASDFSREAQDARVEVRGDLVTLIPGVTARELNIEATVANVLGTLTSLGAHNVAMVFDETPPAVTTEALQDIDTILAQYATNYPAYKEDRTHNLKLAADKIDGMRLEPGAEFSYNNTVGPRTAGAGFKMADVFADGEVRPGMGGGVCQPSSTLFNAALLAGLEISERHNHMMPVSYVPLTRDATVAYDEGLDFRFRNSTQFPIILLAAVDGGTLTCTILGNNSAKCDVDLVVSDVGTIPMEEEEKLDETLEPGAKVEEQKGRGGRRGSLTRVIRRNGTEVSRQLMHRDYYAPRKQLWRVGPELPDAPVIATPFAGDIPGDSVPVDSPPVGGSAPDAPDADGSPSAQDLFNSLAGG